MELACAGNNCIERYPEIAFSIAYGHITPSASTEDPTEIETFFSQIDLQGVELLYLFGVGLGHAYRVLKPWLKEKNERMLILLEEDLSQIAAFAEKQEADEILADPQVSLHLLVNDSTLNDQLKVLTQIFPSPRIEVAAHPAYARTRAPFIKKIRMQLLRETTIGDAQLTEALYSHHLVENVLANFKRWPHSFFANGLSGKFRNVPAIICGAGPSLGPTIPLLKTLSDNALIFAGGSTIAALSNQGIVPHIGLALDPNAEEYSRLRIISSFEMPMIYGNRVQPDVFQTCNGPFGYLHSLTGGPCEAYFEQELGIPSDPIGIDLGPDALSVTAMAIALAVKMGCNPILLNGIDLAYTGMQRYSAGVMPTSQVFLNEMAQEKRAGEKLLRRKGVAGTLVYTLVKWVMESRCIADYAKLHKEVQFINVSAQGLGFKGIPYLPFSQAIQEHCQTSYDLRSWIHAEIQHLDLGITEDRLQELYQNLKESLQRLIVLCDEMLQELSDYSSSSPDLDRTFPTGKMSLIQLDFEEEKAFECFLPHVGPALDQLLNRSHRLPLDRDTFAYRKRLIERLETKWTHLKTMVSQELHYLERL